MLFNAITGLIVFRPSMTAFAEEAYVTPSGAVLRAIVTRSGGQFNLCFGYTENADSYLPAGSFQNSKALVKYVRNCVKHKVGVTTDDELAALRVFSSFHKLDGLTSESVVPDCFDSVEESTKLGKGLQKCGACPYRVTCGEPLAQPKTFKVEEVPESEDQFRARLAQKVRMTYGDGSQ